MKITLIDLYSHFYCNIIRDSLDNKIVYKRTPDFRIFDLFDNLKSKEKKIFGWGDSNRSSFFIILKEIVSNNNIFSKKNTSFIVLHRVIEHFPILLIAIFFRVKPIIIFHGRCDRTRNKIIYSIKYFISFLLFILEKFNFVSRYFIQEESKISYFGNTGFTQKPSIIKNSNFKPKFTSSFNNLVVSNYPERSIISKEIFNKIIINKDQFSVLGASKIYLIHSLRREDLLKKYKTSFTYISLLKFPEVYYNLSLLDACDHSLPLLCLNHKLMPSKFKEYVLTFENYNEMIILVDKLRSSKLEWEKYSKLSNRLLLEYFPSSDFINTWKEIIFN